MDSTKQQTIAIQIQWWIVHCKRHLFLYIRVEFQYTDYISKYEFRGPVVLKRYV